ncbi:MAG: hydrogenase maturation nickel metallochaperone HypA [Armatimonadetes bacterium]|nr:hydrogenase maturation nickel metallochaperone HypA [Armatimonadota bacterium]
MHEHSVADAILEKAEKLRSEAGARSVREIVVQVSELSGLREDVLQMMIAHAAEEMGIVPPKVRMVVDGLLGHCPECGIAPISDELVCARCGREGVPPAVDEAMLLVECHFD